MNEIATRTEYKPALQAGGSIGSIVPQNLDEAFRLSQAIHQAGMSPYGIDTPQKVMIAMLAGLELGMPPMQSVQSIAVINNRPCMWGDGLIAVVRRNSVCLYVKEWIDGEGDSRVAYCETRRRGEDDPVKRSFSVDDAKRAGLWQTKEVVKKKRKDGTYYETANDSPWFKYPQRMLQMRARAWCLRDVYPDVLKGMHAREEVEDYVHAEAEPVTALPPLEERLRIARAEPQSEVVEAEGFDPSFVARETSTASSEAAIEQEASADPSTADDQAAEADVGLQSSAAEPTASQGDQAGGDEAAPASDPSASETKLSEEDRAFLVRVFKAMKAAVGPDVAVLTSQAKIFKDEIAGKSALVKAKAGKILTELEKCCGEDPKVGPLAVGKYLSGLIGVDEKELLS